VLDIGTDAERTWDFTHGRRRYLLARLLWPAVVVTQSPLRPKTLLLSISNWTGASSLSSFESISRLTTDADPFSCFDPLICSPIAEVLCRADDTAERALRLERILPEPAKREAKGLLVRRLRPARQDRAIISGNRRHKPGCAYRLKLSRSAHRRFDTGSSEMSRPAV
jgi:hypothetical protein